MAAQRTWREEVPGAGSVPAVDRAVRILRYLTESGGEAGISELSRDLSLNKSTVHAILSTLRGHGLVERDARSRRYRAGPMLPALAPPRGPAPQVTVQARPALEELLARWNETVFLAVLRDDHVVLIDRAEPDRDMCITSALGQRLPHSAGALGKVFHAWMGPDDLGRLLDRRPLRRFTANTVLSRARYVDELDRVRASGVALDDEEYLEGVRAAAGPLFDPWGRVTAALCLVAPTARVPLDRLSEIGRDVRDAALSVSGGEAG